MMGDRVGSARYFCRSFFASLSRTKHVQQSATRGDANPLPEEARCVPCKLSRYGVGHGGSLAVGVFVVVGYVTGEVAGPSALLSLVIASIVCLITGYCYAEYTSHYPTRTMPATAYHYVYMLSGEFPAVLVAWSQILVYLAVSALLGRRVSFTFDFIMGNPIQNFTEHALAEATTELVPKPDFLAFGVVTCVAILVAFGGKPVSLSNAIFNVVSCCVVLAVIVLAGIQLVNQNVTLIADIFPEGQKGVFRGVALFIFLFNSYDVISTSSKKIASSTNQTAHALAISSIINLIFYLLVGMFYLLVAPFPWTYGNPFLTRLLEMCWGRGAMYTIGISAILCLGSALFNNMCSLVYSVFLLGNDGLVCRFLGRLVSRLQSPVYSAVILGVISGVLGIILEEDVLLELMALGILMKQLIICACTLSHRYQKVRLDVNENIDLEDILKNGHVTNTETEAKTKVLRNGRHHHSKHKSKEKEKIEEKSEKGSSPEVPDTSQTNGKSVRFQDDTSESSGISDIEETDIDAIVEEFHERARIASLTHFENSHNSSTKIKTPSAFTSNVAAGLSAVVCFCAAVTSAILSYRVQLLLGKEPFTLLGLILFIAIAVVSLFLITHQPLREVKPDFKTLLFPLLPVMGIFANVFLLFYICGETWVVFVVWISVNLCMYFCYGICHSIEAKRFSFQQPDEERILLPSIPEQAMHEEFLNGQTSNRQNIGYKDFHEEP